MEREYLVGVMRLDSRHQGHPKKVFQLIREAKNLKLDALVGPEWSLARDKSTSTISLKDPYTPKEARDLLRKLSYATLGSKLLLMPGTMMVTTPSDRRELFQIRGTQLYIEKKKALYNILPVIHNGKIIYSLTKETDLGSSNFDLRNEMILSYVPKPRSFSHNGLRYGVEICGDAGRLFMELRNRPESERLDLQVLSSCGKRLLPETFLRKGGYLVWSDGDTEAVRVYRRNLITGKPEVQIPEEEKDSMVLYSLSL